MAVTQNTYTGNGSTVLYSFTFPYLDESDIQVEVNGTPTTAYTLANATTIQFTSAPANGASIRIFRETDDTETKATFFPGSAIRSQDLNENFTQGLYVTQESRNEAASATSTANTALSTANTAASNATAAVSTANAASSTANSALSTANSAVTTANAASATAGTASTNATTALNTANAASAAAASATSTANTAASNASTALNTANSASANASQAVTTANNASSTATTASSNATTAVNTANSAVVTANAATSTANTALSNSSTAISTANSAAAAVASAVIYQPVVDLTALALLTPNDGDFFELQDSTGADTDPSITGVPVGLVGAAGLTFRLRYDDPPGEYAFLGYFANDSETRYLKTGTGTVTSTNILDGTIVDADISATAAIDPAKINGTAVITTDARLSDTRTPTDGTVSTAKIIDGAVTSGKIADGTIVNADVNASAAIDLSKLATGALPTAITVASANIVDGTIVNADVNASAAIAGTKVSPDFGSQNVTTTGTATAASLNPTGSTVPANGVYLPAANTVGVATNSTKRIEIEADGDINIDSGGVFYDATNNRLAIGSTAPQVLTHLSTSTDTQLRVESTSASGTNEAAVQLIRGSNQSAIKNKAGGLEFFVQGLTNEVARIDSSGRLLIGTSSTSQTCTLLVQGNSAASTSYGIVRLARGISNPSDGFSLGDIDFSDSGHVASAIIGAKRDGGTWTSGSSQPSRLVFSVSADGSASPTEQMRITNAGELRFNSGYGSAAAAYGCRAWVNFNGTSTVAIRASGNVSSITDNGTGDYTVNFATAMPDANYAPIGDANWDNGSQNMVTTWRDLGASNCRVRTVYGINSTNYDALGVFVAIFR